MGKLVIDIYSCVNADILTKVLLKCFWSSPLPTICILSKSLLIGGHGNRKAKFSKNKKKKKKKKTLKNLEAGVLDVDNHTEP